MPLLNLSTSVEIKDKKFFIKKSSELISKLTKKSTSFVMVKVVDSVPMYFSESHDSCCYIEIKSIGSLTPSSMAPIISDFISKEIGIPTNRIYINFENVSSTNWAWDGKTFG
tara:strand:+ start:1245 stop:1580 length:336 start_codon:yes stop_codon:yes gene_type:complete